MSEATHAYIGIAPCGCVRVAVTDDPEATQKALADRAKEISACIRRGYRVERWELERVRAPGAWNCGTEACPFKTGGAPKS